MSKYHAGKNNTPLCGARGNGQGFNVVVVPARHWNSLLPEHKCAKCVAAIAKRKREGEQNARDTNSPFML